MLPEIPDGLARHNARVSDDLELLRLPGTQWLDPTLGPDGQAMLDVVIIGAGMYGLAAAGSLMLRGVHNIRLLDSAAADYEGPWINWARMRTLRSPKALPGAAFGIPSLSYRAWYEARFGHAAWNALYKIPNASWQDYLGWVRERLALPVQNACTVEQIVPENGHVRLRCADGHEMFAQRVVVATGRTGAGGFRRPETVAADLWPDLAAHTSEAIDFNAQRGKRIAVIGAGASAWDNAAEALESGARSVTMFCRREALPQINKGRANANPGFFEGWHTLADAQRWSLAWYLERIQPAPPHESVLRVLANEGFEIRFASPIASARRAGSQIRIDAGGAESQDFDFLILATGFRNELAHEPLFENMAARIRRWRDAYAPPADKASTALGLMPYLGEGFELQARDGQPDPALARIHLFNAAAFASFGTLSLDIPSLQMAGERVAAQICRRLFQDGFDGVFARLQAWQDEHELAPTPFHAPEWVNRLP